MADGPRSRDFCGLDLSGDTKRAVAIGALRRGGEGGYAGARKVTDVAAQVADNRNDLTNTELSFRRDRAVCKRLFERPERRRHVAVQLRKGGDFRVGRLQTLPKKEG